MTAVWLRLRVDARRHWRSWLAVALLVGILANSAITGPSGSGWATLAANNDANNNSFDVSFDSTAQTTASATFAKNDAGTIALEIKHA